MNAKNKFEMLKEENNKLKHKIGEKELLMISLTGQAKKRARKMWQTENCKIQYIHLDKVYIINQETDLLYFKTHKINCMIKKQKL